MKKKGRHRVENALQQLERRLRELQEHEHGQSQKMLRVKEAAHPHRQILEATEDDEELLEKETADGCCCFVGVFACACSATESIQRGELKEGRHEE